MEVWAVSNQKGGVGKTTTTVALAGLLTQLGKKVLLVDIDPQASLTCYFHLEPDELAGSLYTCFEQEGNLTRKDLLPLILPTLFHQLSLLPSSSLLSLVERNLFCQQDSKSPQVARGKGLILRNTLAQLSDDYDYILIDSPPQLGILMINTLAACDRLIVPVQTEFLALKGLERMFRTVQMVMKSQKRLAESVEDILIMPTLFDRRTQTSQLCLRHLRLHYENFIWPSVVPVDTRLRHASKAGVPPSLIYPASAAVLAYDQLLYFLCGFSVFSTENPILSGDLCSAG